ncbi:MAG: hypothetical protein IID33_06880, partial [Planctomycetes bacterium]|nr:hypothetical protein [Planctomycetota bacterium]
YLRIDPRRVYAAIESGAPHEKTTILFAIARCNATLPGEVAAPLLLHPSFDVRMAAGGLVQREALTTDQLRRWALGGRYDATSAALRYVHQHPRAEYADVVADVFRSGGHLFDENLFKAIIVTRATACLDHLRSYLHRQHIDLRRRAAITLAFFGDDSGRKIMLRERARLSALGPSAALAHVKAGLHALVAAK